MIILGLGSNILKGLFLKKAITELNKNKIIVKKISSAYITSPAGFRYQPRFLNAVAEVNTKLKPLELLTLIQRIERYLLRVRFFKNAPRTIDIDILFYNDLIIKTRSLIIPHSRAHLRRFVIVPLLELYPQFIHPLYKKPISEFLENTTE